MCRGKVSIGVILLEANLQVIPILDPLGASYTENLGKSVLAKETSRTSQLSQIEKHFTISVRTF